MRSHDTEVLSTLLLLSRIIVLGVSDDAWIVIVQASGQ